MNNISRIAMAIGMTFLLLTQPLQSFALEMGQSLEEKPILTYEAAVEKATRNSLQLANEYKEKEKLEEQRKTAAEDALYGGNESTYSPLIKRVKSLDASLEIIRRDIEVLEASVEFTTRKAMDNITLLLRQQEVENQELIREQERLWEAQAKRQVGVVSDYDLEKQEETLLRKERETTLLASELATAYDRLNSLLGITDSVAYVMEEELRYEPLDNMSQLMVINQVLGTHPAILNQEKKIEMAALDLQLHVYNVGGDSYDVKQINLSVEQISLKALNSTLEENARAAYHQLQQAEKNHELTEADLRSAEKALEHIQAYYHAGLAIGAQVRDAELQVERLTLELFRKVMDHQYQKEQMLKPYLSMI